MTEPMTLKTLQNFKHWWKVEENGVRIEPQAIPGTPPADAWIIGNMAWVFRNGRAVEGYKWVFSANERSEHE